MKYLTTIVLFVCVLFSLSGCRLNYIEPDEMDSYLDGVVEKIRIRMNDEIIILQTDEAGNFETELHLKSGGNYIMIDYSDFIGSVEMFCAYP